MFEWSDEYAIGNEMIDAEHQVFFGLIRAFHEALSDETDNTRLSRLLTEVSLYAKFHFRSEENLMENMKYPDAKAHRKKHLDILQALTEHMLALDNGRYAARDVNRFLIDCIQHVAIDDHKLSEYIQHASINHEAGLA